MDTLLQTRSVELPQYTLSSDSVAMLQKDAATRETSSADRSTPPSNPVLMMEGGDIESGEPTGCISFLLSFHSGYPQYSPAAFGMDTLGVIHLTPDEEEIVEAEKREKGPAVNLLAHEKVVEGKTPKVSLRKALQLLSQEAGISIYAETFVAPRQVLRFSEGKPEYLLSRLCQDFGCRWRKVGDSYLVTSKSWALDRAANVSQDLLDRWFSLYTKQGGYTLVNLLEMVRLSDRQLPTIEMGLVEMSVRPQDDPPAIFVPAPITSDLVGACSPWNREGLRLIGSLLNSKGLSLAFTSEGATLGTPDADQLAKLRSVFKRNNIAGPVSVHMEEWKKGITIKFTDQLGTATPITVGCIK